MTQHSDARPRGRPWVRPVVILVAALTMGVLSWVFRLDTRVGDLRDWIKSLGPWGMLAYVGVLVVGVVAAIPWDILSIVAGGIFGSLRGVLVVSVGTTIGGALCFLIARHFARTQAVTWLAGHKTFRRMDRIIVRHGATVVAIIRIVPIFPYSLTSYALGLTIVKFWPFVLASFLCVLPVTAIYTVGAAAAFKAIESRQVPWPLIAVVAGVIALLAVLVRFAVRRLRHFHDEDAREHHEDKSA